MRSSSHTSRQPGRLGPPADLYVAGRELLGTLRGRRVTVLGLAREGVDLARYLAGEGAKVLVTDLRPAENLREELAQLDGLEIDLALGGHPPERVLAADLLFVSPGVSPTVPILVEAERRGTPRSSATALFFERCPVPIVGITGSSGKSTTTTLVGEMLKAAGKKVVVGGNIGTPLLGRIPELTPDTLVVMELSSFQLETLDRSPYIATITNVTPNHLDRHGTMEEYTAAKERIFRFQRPSDWTVLNADDAVSRGFRPQSRVVQFSLDRRVKGSYPQSGYLHLNLDGREEDVCTIDEIALRGRHNLANALTATITAALAGATTDAMRATLRSFSGLPHRLQKVGEIRSVSFYDDSIATSPERSMAGIASFESSVILLAGGRDKDLPMDDWAQMIRQRVGGVVMFGEARDLIQDALRRADYPIDRIRQADTIPEAVRAGFDLAEPGQVVLLSPGCTSYDMFRDFVERGHAFATAVRDLSGELA